MIGKRFNRDAVNASYVAQPSRLCYVRCTTWRCSASGGVAMIGKRLNRDAVNASYVAQPSRLCMKTHNRDGCATLLRQK